MIFWFHYFFSLGYEHFSIRPIIHSKGIHLHRILFKTIFLFQKVLLPLLQVFSFFQHQPGHTFRGLSSQPVSQGCCCDLSHPTSCPQAVLPPTPSLTDDQILHADDFGLFIALAHHLGHVHVSVGYSIFNWLHIHDEFSPMPSHHGLTHRGLNVHLGHRFSILAVGLSRFWTLYSDALSKRAWATYGRFTFRLGRAFGCLISICNIGGHL